MKLFSMFFMLFAAAAVVYGADAHPVGDALVESPGPLPRSLDQWIGAAIVVGVVGGLIFFILHRLRNSRARDAKDVTSAQLGVIAAAVSIAAGFASVIFSKPEQINALLVALVAGVFVIQIGEILRAHRMSKKMQSLERALDSDATYSRIDSQLNDLAELSIRVQAHPKAVPLFDEFLADAYNTLNDSLESFSAGTIHVDDTARELTFNKDCLLHLAHKEVWAISYQDGRFWDDPEGRDFLILHDAKLKAGVAIHRIFLLTTAELADSSQKAIIQAQLNRGIDCRILLLESDSNKGEVQPEDFVVYDEAFVRAASFAREGATTTLKRAMLSCDPRKVRLYVQKRNDFKTRSESAADVFMRQQPSAESTSPPLDHPVPASLPQPLVAAAQGSELPVSNPQLP